MFDYKALYEIQLQVSVDFFRVVQFYLVKWKNIYYILNTEIQEFLVKIKMPFLRSLEIFISSREINLCRLDAFSTMVANKPVMYNRLPAFGLLWILFCLQLQLYTSVK